MKKKELNELRGKVKELETLLAKKRKELAGLKVKVLSGKETSFKELRKLKLEISQILTIISEQRIISRNQKEKENK